jgi:hypothetical protein
MIEQIHHVLKFEGSNPTAAGTGRKSKNIEKYLIRVDQWQQHSGITILIII